jgi:hypothetical protein
MDTRQRLTPVATGSRGNDPLRRRKLRQHAASFATGAVVFLASIGLMQALKPSSASLSGEKVVLDRTGPTPQKTARHAPSLSGSSAAGSTGAGSEESAALASPALAASELAALAPPATLASPATTKSTAAQIMGLPSVYIHVLDESTREQALRLAPALEKQGIALAGVKVVGAAPRASDLRYFRPSEKDEAHRIQAILLSLGLPAQRLKSIGGFETSAVPRQYELWLASDYKG